MREIDAEAIERYCALLDIQRAPPGAKLPDRARDEVIHCLGARTPAIQMLAAQSHISLVDLYKISAIPGRIKTVLYWTVRDPEPIPLLYTKDVAAIDETDVHWFRGPARMGARSEELLRSICSIFLETKRFTTVRGATELLCDDLGPEEQGALIERLAKAVRSDPRARRMLLGLFPG